MEYYTARDISEKLNIPPGKVLAWRKHHGISGIIKNGKMVFRKSDVERVFQKTPGYRFTITGLNQAQMDWLSETAKNQGLTRSGFLKNLINQAMKGGKNGNTSENQA